MYSSFYIMVIAKPYRYLWNNFRNRYDLSWESFSYVLEDSISICSLYNWVQYFYSVCCILQIQKGDNGVTFKIFDVQYTFFFSFLSLIRCWLHYIVPPSLIWPTSFKELLWNSCFLFIKSEVSHNPVVLFHYL